MKIRNAIGIGLITAVTLCCVSARAQEPRKQDEAQVEGAVDEKPVKKDLYIIEIKDHRFSPAELLVPAGTKLKLQIVNRDPSAEEFESYDLNREKIVAGGKKIFVFIGPLKPGEYSFFGEFNPETAQGLIIAR